MSPRLVLTRQQILGFRRRVGALDERLPPGRDSLRQAAWAGLQDSMPRAALLSMHARVEGAHPTSWGDPSYVQIWGPRYSAYVVAARDLAVFSLGRFPDDAKGRRRAEHLAARLHAQLAGARAPYGEVGSALGVHPNSLRYAATTGTVVILWDGARQPTVWTVPPAGADPHEARLELARRHLHVFGPTTFEAFAGWAGIPLRAGAAAFDSLRPTLTAVRTPLGDGWILAADEPIFRADPRPAAAARFLPSGDAYFLLQGAERALLVPDADRSRALWTPSVWPGAILVDGEIRGTWRRAHATITVQTWGRCSGAARDALEAEAAALPLPGVKGRIVVRWSPDAARSSSDRWQGRPWNTGAVRPERLTAFTDGVVAILITILVLDLHPPLGHGLTDILHEKSRILAYLLTFVFLAIYWVNHHHLMQVVRRIDGRVLWANLHLLLWLSLTPLATAWLGQAGVQSGPVAAYAIVLLGCAAAYTLLTLSLLALHDQDSQIAQAIGSDRKGKISVAAYVAALLLSFAAPWVAIGLFVAVAIIWFVPDQRIERVIADDR